MSVFLISSIAAFAYIGVFDFKHFPIMPNFVKVIAFVAVFSTLFLFIFFLFNLKRSLSRKRKAVAVNQEGNLRPLSGSVEVPPGVTQYQDGLLVAASAYQRFDLSPPAGIDETSRHDIIYEENGVPYINSDLAKRNNQGTLNNNFVKLVESVTGSLPPPVLRQQNKPDEAHKGSQG
jgi:hypothetical protein